VPTSNYPGVFIEEVPSGVRAITGVATSIAAFIGAAKKGRTNRAMRVQSFADFERQFGGLVANLHLGYAVQQFFQNGGSDAWVVRVAKNATLPKVLKGLRALDAVDLINLLALPGVNDPAIISAAAEYCRQRRAFFIADSPASAKTPSQMLTAIQNSVLPRTSYGAVYYPWIKISDSLNGGQPRPTPPSGTIAGLIARTDSTRGVWKAPAGIEAVLNGVQDVEYKLTDAENGLLNPRAVNCLRVLPNAIVAWGARTLEGDDQNASDWKYIPVSRTALFIEESVDRGLQWTVFEPNAEPLWAQIRLNVGAFMNGLFRQGAFQGVSPKNAYFVKCDAQTTTQNDLNNGVVNLMIGFAPLKPAEFVIIKIQLKAAPPKP
jgi:phage tail sheath protein FI